MLHCSLFFSNLFVKKNIKNQDWLAIDLWSIVCFLTITCSTIYFSLQWKQSCTWMLLIRWIWLRHVQFDLLFCLLRCISHVSNISLDVLLELHLPFFLFSPDLFKFHFILFLKHIIYGQLFLFFILFLFVWCLKMIDSHLFRLKKHRYF